MIVAGSFHGTRTTGTVSVWEIAWSMGHTSFMSVRPCCMSTTRTSKPWRAMISAVNPWETESQPIVTHLPSRQICFILFARIGHLAQGMAGLPARGRSVAYAEAAGRRLGLVSLRRSRREDPMIVDIHAHYFPKAYIELL